MNKPNSQSLGSETQPVEIHTIAKYDFIVALVDEGQVEWDWFNGRGPEIFERLNHSIEAYFASQVQYVFQGSVEVRIQRIEQGSIWGTVVLTLAAGVSLYQFLAQYKDFYDSLILLRQHLRVAINKALEPFSHRQSHLFRVNVALTRVPVQQPIPPAQLRHHEPPPLYSKAFFWYLLAMNLFLMAVIAGLVYWTVATAYSGNP